MIGLSRSLRILDGASIRKYAYLFPDKA